MFKKYPFVKQVGIKDCGVASLMMIIKYYKGDIGIEQLRDMSKTDKNGTSAYHLIDTATKLGFDAKGIKCELKDLNEDNIVLPAIAHVTINNQYEHFIVIYEIDFKKKGILCADPDDKIKKITFNDFNEIWNNILIILYPIHKIPNYKNTLLLSHYVSNVIKQCKKEIINMLMLSMFLTTFSIFTSFFFKYMIDGLVKTNPKEYLKLVTLIFTIVYLLLMITDYFRNKVLIYLNQKIDLLLTLDTFKQIILLPYNYYCNRTTGEVISRINDLGTVRNMISKVAHTLFIDLPLTILSFILLIFVSPKLFIIALILLLLYVLNILIFKPVIAKYINLIQESRALTTSYMVESISGYETIKGINIENKTINNFEQKYIKQLKLTKKFDEYINIQYIIKEFINNIGFLAVIYLGVMLVLSKSITIGQLLTFNALLAYFLSPIRNIIDLDSSFKEATNSLKRIIELYYYSEDNGINTNKASANIVIKDLNYTYNDRDSILNNINLTINQGEKIMIVGNSGSGKSTLLKILMKYHKVDRGQLYINNQDINDYKLANYREGLSYISQNEMLFTDTLYNNLKITSNLNKEILEISEMCEVESIVRKTNTGYNMLIEENGSNISGGEKQRIVLARALLKEFNILLIDEGMNQMDINLERRILKRLMSKYHDKIIIIISHRLDNMDLFDKLIELENGTIKRMVEKNV